MNREHILTTIKETVKCTDYLTPAPNHSGNNGYCCPVCGSGTHGARSTGALTFYADTNTWHCHACDAGGDVIDLYKIVRGVEFVDAVRDLSGRLGLQEDSSLSVKNVSVKEKAEEEEKAPTADYTNYYKACAERINDPVAVSYLKGRGISIETAKKYGVGYDPSADPGTAPGAMADEYKPHPCPRLIFPCSRSHYVGRSVDANTPKGYRVMNPSRERGGGEVSIFNMAAVENPESNVVFVCEGTFDALSFLEAGYSAIALNSKGNGRLLTKFLMNHEYDDEWQPKQFVVVPDNDVDPKTAADTLNRTEWLRAGICRAGCEAITYNVAGEHHDANDAWKEDPDTFRKNAESAIEHIHPDDLTLFLDKIMTDAYRPHPTGEKWFDDLLDGGIINQSLLFLMAAPSTGKTTLAAQIAESIAANGRNMIFINLEMSREQLLAKAISAYLYRGGVWIPTGDVMRGYDWTPTQESVITRCLRDYREFQLPHIRYNPDGFDSGDVDKLLKKLDEQGQAAREKGDPAPGLVVDYLQMLTAKGSPDAQELIKRAVYGLKNYAVKYDSFVIAVVATNRASNKSGRITDSSGRDSSGIEYTGDVILSLNYEDIDKGAITPEQVNEMELLKLKDPRRMVLRMHKNRLGAIKQPVYLNYYTRFNVFEADERQETERKKTRARI